MIPFPRRFETLPPHARQWLMLALFSAAFAALLDLVGIPAAVFLGPMAAGVVLGVKGATIRVAHVPYIGAQALMGLFIASAITPSILQSFAKEWPIILGVVFSIIVASSLLGWAMSRWRAMPGTTSIWGSWPGAAGAMVIMAGEFGADARLVAFMQYFRVACVASLASVVATFWAHSTGVPHPDIAWFPAVNERAFAVTLLLAGICAVLGRASHFPSGAMLLALLAGSALNLAGLVHIELPKWLMAATYALLGWNVGLCFTPDILAHAFRALPKIVLSVASLIAFSAVLAWLLTETLGIDPLTAYLATSPGGMDSVAIIAASTNVDVPFVMALQTIRFLIIIMIGPPLARLVARHMEVSGRYG
ncbi:ammonia monooxygenase [Rhodomicrobium udaipurense JA643]|uniref:AbrB family transcriptional regulator n=1 Tax=Rhodomicrobium udaipurense TaxID=1202716 RepID=A0A8I1GD83_9HYPH|nr:AbrB family transcriptional regulator [Rhodomicrobium udaipurense]KAI96076.1 ammonia monooxygenase [Rhodomicrobium udaipurense JA643]MBJ7542759.1 AbrB family transcriptional regulator [Rhodomicrobium udaipurense]